jgi:hypothetical protein
MPSTFCHYCKKIIYAASGQGASSGRYKDPVTGEFVHAHFQHWLDAVEAHVPKKKKGKKKDEK